MIGASLLNYHKTKQRGGRGMVCNVAFNNISVISWRSVLLVEETGVHRENHGPAINHGQTLFHNVVSPEWDSN